MMESSQVALAGIGVVSSIGIGREAFSTAVCERRRQAGMVQGFRVEDFLQTQKTYLDRCSAFALAACALALKDAEPATAAPAKLHLPSSAPHDHPSTGICLGTAFGCLQTMEDFLVKVLQKGPRFANSLLFSHSYANTPASLAAIEFNLNGYHSTVTSGRQSGLLALLQAVDAIRLGHADRMLAGGVEVLSDPLLRVWDDLFPDCKAGEGAAFFVLEPLLETHTRHNRLVLIDIEVVPENEMMQVVEPVHVEDLIGFTVGASVAMEVAAVAGRVQSGESMCAEIVSKVADNYVRIRLEKCN